ncbi:hypothetical protein GEMRC1_004494 [Eukaryota sp. GEM-RC1]
MTSPAKPTVITVDSSTVTPHTIVHIPPSMEQTHIPEDSVSSAYKVHPMGSNPIQSQSPALSAFPFDQDPRLETLRPPPPFVGILEPSSAPQSEDENPTTEFSILLKESMRTRPKKKIQGLASKRDPRTKHLSRVLVSQPGLGFSLPLPNIDPVPELPHSPDILSPPTTHGSSPCTDYTFPVTGNNTRSVLSTDIYGSFMAVDNPDLTEARRLDMRSKFNPDLRSSVVETTTPKDSETRAPELFPIYNHDGRLVGYAPRIIPGFIPASSVDTSCRVQTAPLHLSDLHESTISTSYSALESAGVQRTNLVLRPNEPDKIDTSSQDSILSFVLDFTGFFKKPRRLDGSSIAHSKDFLLGFPHHELDLVREAMGEVDVTRLQEFVPLVTSYGWKISGVWDGANNSTLWMVILLKTQHSNMIDATNAINRINMDWSIANDDFRWSNYLERFQKAAYKCSFICEDVTNPTFGHSIRIKELMKIFLIHMGSAQLWFTFKSKIEEGKYENFSQFFKDLRPAYITWCTSIGSSIELKNKARLGASEGIA